MKLAAAAELYETLQIEDGIAQVYSDQGLLALARGNMKEADRRLSQAMARWEELSYPEGIIETKYRQSRVALARGNAQEAERLAGEALGGYEETGDRLNSTRCRLVVGRARLVAGNTGGAASSFDAAEEDARSLGNVLLLVALDAGRAELALATGEGVAARPLIDSVCSRAEASSLALLHRECDRLREKISG